MCVCVCVCVCVCGALPYFSCIFTFVLVIAGLGKFQVVSEILVKRFFQVFKVKLPKMRFLRPLQSVS